MWRSMPGATRYQALTPGREGGRDYLTVYISLSVAVEGQHSYSAGLVEGKGRDCAIQGQEE